MRGSEHSKSLRIYKIIDKGLTIGESLEDFEGVTTGVSKKIAELKKESEDLKRIIIEKEKAEKSLQESERKFKAISTSAQDGIIIVDNNGNVNYWNKAAEKMFGYKYDEIIGKGLHRILTSKGFYVNYKKGFSKVKDTGNGATVGKTLELCAVKKDGTEFPIELSMSLVKIKNKWNAIGIIRDISNRKKAEEKIEQQNVQLKKLNRLKSEFFDVISREIRQPLAILKGYIQMLLNHSFGVITETQRKPLEIVIGKINRLDGLSSNLLDISRLELGDMRFIPEKTNIGQMIKETVETMQSSADLKDIKINLEYGDKVPDLIIDQYRIKQVIMNLLDNAIKFSPEESVINLRAKKQEDNFLFEVQDFGQGIPKGKQDKIFETFYRVDEGINEKFKGGGIGLAISQGIIIVHGGKIWCESKEGEGSTFRFTLPIKNVEDIKTSYKGFNLFGSVQKIKDTKSNEKNKN